MAVRALKILLAKGVIDLYQGKCILLVGLEMLVVVKCCKVHSSFQSPAYVRG